MKKRLLLLATILTLSSFGNAVTAFADVEGKTDKQQIGIVPDTPSVSKAEVESTEGLADVGNTDKQQIDLLPNTPSIAEKEYAEWIASLPDEWEEIAEPEEIPEKEGKDADASSNPTGDALSVQARAAGQWLQGSGGWWYRHHDGTYTTSNWELIDGKWYYFDAQGWMKTGWIQHKGGWYYCNGSGVMQVGWIQLSGQWYYLNENGLMQTEWQLLGGKWYYFNSNGVMQILWVQIGGKWYFFNSSGIMMTGWFEDNKGVYNYSNESTGAWIDNTGTRMIQEAIKYVGNPYVWGGESLTNGVDCSGYTMLIHRMYNISLPHNAQSQWYSGGYSTTSNPQPGDLGFYGTSTGNITHVVFYMGKVDFTLKGKPYKSNQARVHAANSNKGIVIEDTDSYKFLGYKRFW